MSTVAETPVIPQQKPASSVAMIATLGLVSTISGVLLVFVYQATMPRILANRQAALEAAVFQVIPGAATRATFAMTEDGFAPLAEGEAADDLVYAGYDGAGNLAGVAVRAQGQGYQDIVAVLFGFSPDAQEIVGFQVMECKETPGLGDRIKTDEAFLANFDGLLAAVNDDGTGLATPITLVKGGDRAKGEIDGISGATISSRAVTDMINKRAQYVIPIIMKHLDELKEQPSNG